MAGNRTFTMIKPEAVAKGLTGKILDKILGAGFEIIGLKKIQLTKENAKAFYEVHKDQPFYEDLTDYMSGGPIIAAAIKKDNAVADFRKLLGTTNPEEAAEGTIRKEFAESKSKNAAHGSDSDENATIEIEFHFMPEEIVE